MKARFAFACALTSTLLLASLAMAEKLSPEAQRHFDAGVAYVDDPSGSKWEEAFKEFRAAYAVSPNWKLLNNIGLCALNLERDGEAIEAFKDYLSHGGEKDFTAKQRKQMETDISTLSASLVRLNVSVEPAEASLLDERKNSKGELIVNRYPVKAGKASLGIHPGHHKVTIEAPGYVSASWTVDAEPSSTHSHDFKLDPEKKAEAAPAPEAPPVQPTAEMPAPTKPAERRTPAGVYIGLAATGVFAAAATTTGIIALGKNKDYDNATTTADEDQAKNSGKTFVLLTDIGIGAAILSAGATAYFYFTAPKESPAPTAARTNIRFTPVASPSSAGFAISGKF